MKQNFLISIFLPIILSTFISIFFIPSFQNNSTNNLNINLQPYYNSSISSSFVNNISAYPSYSLQFLWPTPGYSKITSDFGYRTAPTAGAGTYHGGIDIAAPENSIILSIANGTIIFADWYGANGYTIIIEHSNNYKSIYGHVSPNFLVSVGDSVKKGDIIAKVGPKYIEKKSFTTYIDKTGKYTNGATTGPHLHFSITKNNKKINPKNFFSLNTRYSF